MLWLSYRPGAGNQVSLGYLTARSGPEGMRDDLPETSCSYRVEVLARFSNRSPDDSPSDGTQGEVRRILEYYRVTSRSESGRTQVRRTSRLASAAAALQEDFTGRSVILDQGMDQVRVVSPGGVSMLLMPAISGAYPVDWTLKLATKDTDGWPLLDDFDGVALGDPRPVIWAEGESVCFYQGVPEQMNLGAIRLNCVTFNYSGNHTGSGRFHGVKGKLWIHETHGVIREERVIRNDEGFLEGRSRSQVIELTREWMPSVGAEGTS